MNQKFEAVPINEWKKGFHSTGIYNTFIDGIDFIETNAWSSSNNEFVNKRVTHVLVPIEEPDQWVSEQEIATARIEWVSEYLETGDYDDVEDLAHAAFNAGVKFIKDSLPTPPKDTNS